MIPIAGFAIAPGIDVLPTCPMSETSQRDRVFLMIMLTWTGESRIGAFFGPEDFIYAKAGDVFNVDDSIRIQFIKKFPTIDPLRKPAYVYRRN